MELTPQLFLGWSLNFDDARAFFDSVIKEEIHTRDAHLYQDCEVIEYDSESSESSENEIDEESSLEQIAVELGRRFPGVSYRLVAYEMNVRPTLDEDPVVVGDGFYCIMIGASINLNDSMNMTFTKIADLKRELHGRYEKYLDVLGPAHLMNAIM